MERSLSVTNAARYHDPDLPCSERLESNDRRLARGQMKLLAGGELTILLLLTTPLHFVDQVTGLVVRYLRKS